MTELFEGRIGIIGAGALGCYYGARLARAGHDVHFLMRSDYETVRERGFKIFSVDGDFELRPAVYPSPQALGRCDLIIIGLKTTDNAALPELLGPSAGPETLVLTLQNGLGNEEAIVNALEATAPPSPAPAAGRVLGGSAFLCSNRTGPGVIHHTDHGWIRLAELAGPARPRTHAIAELFRSSGVRCEVSDSLAQIRWEKLVWNIPFNGLGGVGLDTAQVLAEPALARAARALMDEVIAAARADGVAIDPAMAGKMMTNTTSMGPYRTSMQIDYETGRPMEIESILGEPLRRAQAAGIDTPRMELLCGAVRQLATGRDVGEK